MPGCEHVDRLHVCASGASTLSHLRERGAAVTLCSLKADPSRLPQAPFVAAPCDDCRSAALLMGCRVAYQSRPPGYINIQRAPDAATRQR